MNHRRHVAKLCKPMLLLGWVWLSHSAMAWAEELVEITALQGQAFVLKSQGAPAEPVGVGQRVAAGWQLKTAQRSQLQLKWPDGSVLQLGERTSLTLSAHQRKSGLWSVLLSVGQVLATILKPSPQQDHATAHRFQIVSANAICGVRGTTFQTEVRDDGVVLLQVEEGLVALQGEYEQQQFGPASSGQASQTALTGLQQPLGAEQRRAWRAQSTPSLRQGGAEIVKGVTLQAQKQATGIQAWRNRQQEAKGRWLAMTPQQRQQPEGEQIRRLMEEANQALADLGDKLQVESQFMDHLADLAKNPMFRGLSRQVLAAEAKSLRAVAASMEALVKEGMAMTMEDLERQLESQRQGKGGTLRFDRGSSQDELFR